MSAHANYQLVCEAPHLRMNVEGVVLIVIEKGRKAGLVAKCAANEQPAAGQQEFSL